MLIIRVIQPIPTLPIKLLILRPPTSTFIIMRALLLSLDHPPNRTLPKRPDPRAACALIHPAIRLSRDWEERGSLGIDVRCGCLGVPRSAGTVSV